MKSPCVLIPSYNEGRTIGGIVRRLKDRGFVVYVVDDGSADDTAQVSAGAGAIVISNGRNLGKGAAIRNGFARIFSDGNDSVIIMDGDDQHNIEDIAHLIRRMRESGAGIVIGNRMNNTASMPRTRIVVNRFMSGLISRIAGQEIPDSQCGFRIIRKEVADKIRLESSKFEIESEMIIRAAQAGFKISSVEIKTVYQDERSRINPILDTLRFIVFLTKLKFR